MLWILKNSTSRLNQTSFLFNPGELQKRPVRMMILVCPQINNFCRQLGHPHRPNFYSTTPKKEKKWKASDVVSLSISSVVSKFTPCTHLKVTTCKLALSRLTLPHLQERGRWETKQFMGMALSAPQTPPAKTKNEQNILYRS